VGILETKKEAFHDSFLNNICRNFSWNFLPATGTAGGILVGLKASKFHVINWDFYSCVSVKIKNICDSFVWRLVVVYGSPYEQGKQEFIDELHVILDSWDGPMVFGGDFNLIRESSNKNNGNINYHWAHAFNNWINAGGLIEIKNPTRSYTWTNNQEEPIMAVLDRVFVTTNFENQYPGVNIRGTPRVGSYHVPIIVELGINPSQKPYIFRFEKWWLEREEFQNLVAEVWNTQFHCANLLYMWQTKLKLLRRKIKGWSKNVNGEIRKHKRELLEEFDILDIFSEENLLSPAEKDRMDEIQR
jgi:hypothetical protein